MMAVINYFKRLTTLDDSIKKTNSFRENGGIYMVLGSLYKSRWPLTCFTLILLTSHLYLTCYTCYYCTFILDEIEITTEAAHFSLVLCWGVLFVLVPHLEKKHFDAINRLLAEGVFKYSDTLDPQTAAEADYIEAAMFKRKMIRSRRMEVGYNLFCFLSFAVFPIVGGKLRKPEKDDELFRQAPVQGWYPYETKSWVGWLAGITTEYYIAFMCLCILDGTDIPFLCYSEEMLFQLTKLNLTLRHTIRRAKYIYKTKYGQNPVTLKGNKTFSGCLKKCLGDNIRHHYSINIYFIELRCAYRKIFAIILISGAVLLCMSGLIFYSNKFKIGAKLSFMVYLIGELIHIFVFCYYGEYVSQLSFAIRASAYDMDWTSCSKDVKPYISLIQMSTNTPFVFTSTAGLFVCNFDSFGSVIRSAYSYFNLLLAAIEIN